MAEPGGTPKRRGSALRSLLVVAGAASALFARGAFADPALVDPSVGTLELLTPVSEQSKLDRVDGLALDAFGNLIAVLEISGAAGGVVYVDKQTGVVTSLVTGISRADQIALHPSGDLFVTSEVTPTSTTQRIYRVAITYDGNDVPLSATATSLTTSVPINNPEGLVVLESGGPYGNAGDLYVCEDLSGGDVLRIDPATGTAVVLVADLARPEGLAFGDFGGATAPALFVAETSLNRLTRIASDGATSTLGDPSAVSLVQPDNVEMGPDGFLYVSEDRSLPSSRVIRIAADGTHSVLATGFAAAQGMVFDPETGDLYITEQGLDRIWRLSFASPEPVPVAAPMLPMLGLLLIAALLLATLLGRVR